MKRSVLLETADLYISGNKIPLFLQNCIGRTTAATLFLVGLMSFIEKYNNSFSQVLFPKINGGGCLQTITWEPCSQSLNATAGMQRLCGT